MELEHLGGTGVKPEKSNNRVYKIAVAICVCLCAVLLLALIVGKSFLHTHTHMHFSSTCIIILKAEIYRMHAVFELQHMETK